MGLGSHLEDAIDEDLRAALGEDAEDIGYELMAGAIGMDADAEGLHALDKLGGGEGMELIEMDALRQRSGRRKRVARGAGWTGGRKSGPRPSGWNIGRHGQEKRWRERRRAWVWRASGRPSFQTAK